MKNQGELLSAILKEYRGYYIFLHNTKEIGTVESIINEGFIFESQLPHSTDHVNPDDPVEITYFLFQRKEYGQYTLIIAIPGKTFEIYNRAAADNNTGIEEIVSVTEPFYGDNDELVYTMPPGHILGYFDQVTSEFRVNKKWDPRFINKKRLDLPVQPPDSEMKTKKSEERS